MKGDFVNQGRNTKTLMLASGEMLTVRKRLTAGERRAAMARMSTPSADGRAHVNPLWIGLGTVHAFLVDWTVTDDEGAIVPYQGLSADDQASVLDELDPDTFDEIRAAIDAHENAMLIERREEKKRWAGGNGSSAMPPSLNTTDGPTPPLPN